MTPTKIVLEMTDKQIRLRVFAADTLHGSVLIESVPFVNGVAPKVGTVALMKKHGAAYAKRFGIPYEENI